MQKTDVIFSGRSFVSFAFPSCKSPAAVPSRVPTESGPWRSVCFQDRQPSNGRFSVSLSEGPCESCRAYSNMVGQKATATRPSCTHAPMHPCTHAQTLTAFVGHRVPPPLSPHTTQLLSLSSSNAFSCTTDESNSSANTSCQIEIESASRVSNFLARSTYLLNIPMLLGKNSLPPLALHTLNHLSSAGER